jgi:hypothetical protein
MVMVGIPAVAFALVWQACYNSIESNQFTGSLEMSPTVFHIGSFRFFFNSREESRRHVHIQTPDGVAKFWLEPTIALASYHKLNARMLRKLDELVREHENEIKSEWDRHFSQ